MFARLECYDVLQPEPQSGEGCNTLLHEGLLIYGKECYIVIVIWGSGWGWGGGSGIHYSLKI